MPDTVDLKKINEAHSQNSWSIGRPQVARHHLARESRVPSQLTLRHCEEWSRSWAPPDARPLVGNAK